MYLAMANSPGLLETYLDGYARFRQDSGFSPTEQEVVLLTISRSNGCDYCMAAHSMIADKAGAPTSVTDAIREGRDIPDPKLAALSVFVDRMLSTRGRPGPDDVASFLAAGYSERQILEIVLAIAVKTLSNYTNHLFGTPLDERFAGRKWAQA
jgi:AhpD family alkylhydroperoxidase